MPFGGKYQLTPQEGMAAKIPVLEGDTCTGTLMAYGYNPSIAKWSPFHGAVYAIVEALSRIVAMGGNYRTVRLSLQEYFEKLGKDPAKWGKPFSALLGAAYVQLKLGIPAVGGKDSMSGTFKDMNVPPTLVAFAVNTADVNKVISAEFKREDSNVVLLPLNRDEHHLPDFEQLERNFSRIYELACRGKILSAHSVRHGGIAEAISKMCFGNKTGFRFIGEMDAESLFSPDYGSVILEIPKEENVAELFEGLEFKLLGVTSASDSIEVNGESISLETAIEKWEEPLEKIFPTRVAATDHKRQNTDHIHIRQDTQPRLYLYEKSLTVRSAGGKSTSGIARPRVFIPVFPGTNCEYETARAFEKAGAIVETMVIKNLSPRDVEQSVRIMADKINNSQIVMIP